MAAVEPVIDPKEPAKEEMSEKDISVLRKVRMRWIEKNRDALIQMYVDFQKSARNRNFKYEPSGMRGNIIVHTFANVLGETTEEWQKLMEQVAGEDKEEDEAEKGESESPIQDPVEANPLPQPGQKGV